MPDRSMLKKLAEIRKQNVEKYAGYDSKQVLQRNIARHQVNHQYQMEHDRLKQASVLGPLQSHAQRRLEHLKNRLVSK